MALLTICKPMTALLDFCACAVWWIRGEFYGLGVWRYCFVSKYLVSRSVLRVRNGWNGQCIMYTARGASVRFRFNSHLFSRRFVVGGESLGGQLVNSQMPETANLFTARIYACSFITFHHISSQLRKSLTRAWSAFIRWSSMNKRGA